jgi:UDP-N-acetylmuramate: L-alanyl-gamma-D-glutamyl-meso-diaminopimelate ligase
MEVRGEVNGITLIDDFGHHPTAILETIKALRIRYPHRKMWAVFEPRSNTTRRNVFQNELAQALSLADEAIVSEVARLEQLNPSERLNPNQLISDIINQGKKASYLPNIEDIVKILARDSKPGDVIAIFSNGGFGGIHEKILNQLKS